MIIAVDFDGTIVEHRFPAIGKPIPFAFDALKSLQREGHKIILWTNREGNYLKDAIDFCESYGLAFYSVNSEFPDAGWTGSGVSRKIVADVYIDDKNLGGLPAWTDIYAAISDQSKKAEIYAKQRSHERKKRDERKMARKRIKSLKFFKFFSKIADRCREARNDFKIN